MNRFVTACLLSLSVLPACDGGGHALLPGDTPGPEGGVAPDAPPLAPSGARTCSASTESRRYVGFGGVALEAGRVDEETSANRARMKPTAALATEYARVLGRTPATFAAARSSIEEVKPRWFEEPRPTALGLTTLFRVAFDGCLDHVAKRADLAAVGTEASAEAPCAAMITSFWDRAPTPDEVRACARLATVETATEPDPRRRWAYACAAALTAEGFLLF